MFLTTVSPNRTTDLPTEQDIIEALQQLYDQKLDAVILVADQKKNQFMQMGCGGGHIEHCVGPSGQRLATRHVKTR